MKDPAFLFYPGDWLGGTVAYTRYHKGAYMDLLMAQFNIGHLSIEQIKIILGDKDEYLWESILKLKFLQDSCGNFYNEKLENEMLKRKNFVDSRKKNLSSHMDSHMGRVMDVHMENGNGNIIKDSKLRKKKDIQGKGKDIQIPDHLKEIWIDYLEMRKKIKKPATIKAQYLVLNKLNDLYPNSPENQKICLEQSILNSWQGVFEIKESKYKNQENESVPKLKNPCPTDSPTNRWKFIESPKKLYCKEDNQELEMYISVYDDLCDDDSFNLLVWCPKCGEQYLVNNPENWPEEYKKKFDIRKTKLLEGLDNELKNQE